MDIFVYGTLRDKGVREAVLGHPVAKIIPARIIGYSQRWVKGEAFPMIRPYENQTAEGMILCGLSDADVDKLDRFEGVNYQRQPLTAVDDDGNEHQVEVYHDISQYGAQYEDGGFFDLDDWAARSRDDFISNFMQSRGFDAPKN